MGAGGGAEDDRREQALSTGRDKIHNALFHSSGGEGGGGNPKSFRSRKLEYVSDSPGVHKTQVAGPHLQAVRVRRVLGGTQVCIASRFPGSADAAGLGVIALAKLSFRRHMLRAVFKNYCDIWQAHFFADSLFVLVGFFWYFFL